MGLTKDEELTRLWCIRKTCHEILRDRGYIIPDEDINLTMDAFKASHNHEDAKYWRDQMTILASKKDDPADQIFVFFSDESRLGVKTIRSYMNRMDTLNISRALLICKGGVSAFVNQILVSIQPTKIIEQFKESELMINITKHCLVPKHYILDEEQKETLLKRYKLKPTQLPRIEVNDAISRYYGLTKGQIVRIVRPSETAGRYVTYRCVV